MTPTSTTYSQDELPLRCTAATLYQVLRGIFAVQQRRVCSLRAAIRHDSEKTRSKDQLQSFAQSRRLVFTCGFATTTL